MEIILNNQKHTVEEGTVLLDVISFSIGDRQKGIAVAVNNTVISKDQWAQTVLNDNDNVLIIKVTQGG